MQVHVRTLGRASVVVEGRAVSWPTRQTEDLFFLLLDHERGYTKAEIVGRLWDSQVTPATSGHLKVTHHRLRQALRHPEAVTEADGRSRLAPVYHQNADLHLFRAALTRVRGTRDREAQLHHAYQALSLYLGDYLPDQAAGWAEETRDSLRSAYVRLRLDVAAWHCSAVECQAGVRNLAAGLSADLLVGETYHQTLMTCLCTLGRADDATLHYRHFLRFLQRDLGDTPSRATQRLADHIKNGEPHAACRIGESLPCPRRLLYGTPDALRGRGGEPLDLIRWDEELRRGRQMLNFVHRLARARDWTALAQTVQVFLAGQLRDSHVWLAPRDPDQPGGRARRGGLEALAWPEAALAAARAALGQETAPGQQPAFPGQEAGPTGAAPMVATVMIVRDARREPCAWLCVVRPHDSAPGSGEVELQERVVDALCHVLSQERWQRMTFAVPG